MRRYFLPRIPARLHWRRGYRSLTIEPQAEQRKLAFRKLLKPESRILAFSTRGISYQFSAHQNIFKQATFLALEQLPIAREQTQRSGLFLQGSHE
jgi:hypothetical protein